MDFIELARQRYTTKAYDGSVLSQDVIHELQEILRLCPSSINSQPWKFVFVSGSELKESLAKTSFFNEEKVRKSSHLVVFCVRNKVEEFETYLTEKLSQRVVDYYNRMLKPQGDTAVQHWMEKQVYVALGYFLTACAEMGIDSTPMEGIDTAGYDRLLNIDGYRTLFAVAIGKRDPEDSNQPSITPKWRLPKEDVIVER
ncbi:nitroreductase family protein [Bacteroides heparinolyticus]|uniref:nitroreductase family protein n=1 Tax=Prevotella heparinolytica TaxID=28113 RepID=UPI0035A17593